MLFSLPQYRSVDFLKKHKTEVKKVAAEVYKKKAAIAELLKTSYDELCTMVKVLGVVKDDGAEPYYEMAVYHEMLSMGDLMAFRLFNDTPPKLYVMVDNDHTISALEYEFLISQDKCAVVNAAHHVLETCVKRLNQDISKSKEV